MRTEANTRDCHKMETSNGNLIPFLFFSFLLLTFYWPRCAVHGLGLMMRGNLIYFDGCQQLASRTPPPPAPS